MDTEERITTLLDRLVEKTKDGSVQWEEMTDGSFQLDLPSASIVMKSLGVFQIIKNEHIIVSRHDEPYLYELARRNARHVEEFLAELLKELGIEGDA